MILDQVEIEDRPHYHEMAKWCNENIGNMAMWKDNVNEYNPWAYDYLFRTGIYYFAREEDAMLFRLKWL